VNLKNKVLIEENIRNQVLDQVRSRAGQRTWGKVRDHVLEKVADKTYDQILWKVWNEVRYKQDLIK
jgi:hypothetical protein